MQHRKGTWLAILAAVGLACRTEQASFSTAPPPPPSAWNFHVTLTGRTVACHLDVYDPVRFSAEVAVGEQVADSFTRTPGRYRLSWHAVIGGAAYESGARDS